ncbi:MAG: serine/threonine-protein kinase [Planctomycetota bacterium]
MVRDRPEHEGDGEEPSSTADGFAASSSAGSGALASQADPDEFLRQNPSLAGKIRRVLEELDGTPSDAGANEARAAAAEETPRFAELTLGKYRIIREIGCGAMATVCEAEQFPIKRRVALKILLPPFSLSPKVVSRFHREAQACARLSHPGIVTLYELGEFEGIYYITQELVEGGYTLAHRLEAERHRPHRTPDYRDIAELLAQVAEALQHAHEQGVIHRDIKPSNVLITQDGQPKVSDFGLARIEDEVTLSRTGEIVGTPAYMSPEQARGLSRELDHRTDIFSLGVTLYEALTLSRPFQSHSSTEIIQQILDHDPRPPDKVNPDVPVALARICMKAMEKDAKRRYATMRELADDLHHLLAGEPVRARPSSWFIRKAWRSPRRRLLTSVAAVALTLTLAVAGMLVTQRGNLARARGPELADGFESVVEALGYPSNRNPAGPEETLVRLDPGDPSSEMLEALRLFTTGEDWKATVQALGECIERCRRRGELELERDAHYLQALVKLRWASTLGSDPLGILLEQEARAALEMARDTSADSLVWRCTTQTGADWFREGPKIRSDHYVPQLARGAGLLATLYRGGTWSDFKEAADLFETVLRKRPDSAIAATCLARTLLFFARSYECFEVLDEAEHLLVRVVKSSPQEPSHWVYVTLGQIRALQRRPAEAIDVLEKALELIEARTVPDSECHIWNVWCGLATARAHLGEFEEAEALWTKARLANPSDVHVNTMLAEFCISQGRAKEALSWADQALRVQLGTAAKVDSGYQPAYLAGARAFLQLGDGASGAAELRMMVFETTVRSVRHMALGCLVAYLASDDTEAGGWSHIVSQLAEVPAFDIPAEHARPPVCLAAAGAAALARGDFQTAIRRFCDARERRMTWSEQLHRAYRLDDARDLFFEAIALSESGDRATAARRVAEAETIWNDEMHSPRFIEYADITERARRRAQAELGL